MRSITSQERIIMNNFRKTAFTLAEVLITLGIIGVVAALTMPSLIAHHRKVATASKLKKFYSTMEQAIRFGEAEYGDSNEWVKPHTQKDENGNIDNDAQGRVSKEFFMTYLAPYFKYTDVVQGKQAVDEDGNDKSTSTKVYLADGTTFAFNNGGCMDFQFDTNGDKLPNEFGRDKFVFFMCFSDAERQLQCGSSTKAFCTPKYGARTREDFIAKCKQQPYWCSSLLEYDNWEFRSDYPYRL